MINWHEHIVSDPDILFGKPVIKGTRVPVNIIFEKIAEGYSFDELIQAYPRVTKEDIQACLLYASDNAQHDKALSVV